MDQPEVGGCGQACGVYAQGIDSMLEKERHLQQIAQGMDVSRQTQDTAARCKLMLGVLEIERMAADSVR